jgi:hypothetical protein
MVVVGVSVLEAAMVSWLEELERREAAARDIVEELRRRIGELSEQLEAAEQALTRLAITKETMTEILGAGSDAAGLALGLDAGAGAGVVVQEPNEGVAEQVSGSGSPIGVIKVPLRVEGMAVSVLPQEYRDILEVLTDAGRGLRCAHVAAGLGIDSADRSIVESVRSKLKRLTARGWLTEPMPGMFTVADGVTVNG